MALGNLSGNAWLTKYSLSLKSAFHPPVPESNGLKSAFFLMKGTIEIVRPMRICLTSAYQPTDQKLTALL